MVRRIPRPSAWAVEFGTFGADSLRLFARLEHCLASNGQLQSSPFGLVCTQKRKSHFLRHVESPGPACAIGLVLVQHDHRVVPVVLADLCRRQLAGLRAAPIDEEAVGRSTRLGFKDRPPSKRPAPWSRPSDPQNRNQYDSNALLQNTLRRTGQFV